MVLYLMPPGIHLSQCRPASLSIRIHGKPVQKDHFPRLFIAGNMFPAEVDHVLLADGGIGIANHEGDDPLSPDRVWNANYRRSRDVIYHMIISNFVTNSAAIIIVLPIALSACTAMGYNPLPFCIGITFGASFACSTPLAAAQIAMTLVAGYKFSDYLKYTLPLALILLIGTLVFVPLFYPLA